MSQETQKCPYCGEDILKIAIKCKYCQSMLNSTTSEDKEITVTGKRRNSLGMILGLFFLCIGILGPVEHGTERINGILMFGGAFLFLISYMGTFKKSGK